jgi:pimeloyl-ACP methyl ester carboxylesterase
MAVNNIVESARELEERRQASTSGSSSSPWHLPILGAAMTDLPPKEEDKESYYAKITCPVLILCHGGDEAHPLETGSVLKTLIPQSRLHVAASNEDDARRDWPRFIADWLVEEGIVRLPPQCQ